MEKFVFPASLKNIPIPSREVYQKLILAKTCEFIERLRWKVFFFLNPKAKKSDVPETFGFKTSKSAPQSKEITAFEQDVLDLVTNVKFKSKPQSVFQKELQGKVSEINKSDKVFLMADKTTNIYKVKPEEYKKLLTENITKDYRKSSENSIRKVNKEAKKIAEKLKIEDRIEMHGDNSAFITIKDHKPHFEDNPKCRLINPAKSDMGKVSKQILEKLNKEIRETTGLKQWRSTQDALAWFNQLPEKKHLKFLQLDIVEFYPSISSELLEDAMLFAEEVIGHRIDKTSKDIILNARKAFLFTAQGEENIPWVKKTREDFDVTMGAPDGAELCEFVGLFLLDQVRKNIPDLNFGLYRDDGLATFNNMSGRQQEQMKQKLHRIFNHHGLKITIETNLTTTNFLDVTFNLRSGSYKPFRKPNDRPLYVNTKSNHPPNVIKEIPKSINNRLRKISSTKDHFDEAKGDYQTALINSGYTHILRFESEETTPKSVSDETTPKTMHLSNDTIPKTVQATDETQHETQEQQASTDSNNGRPRTRLQRRQSSMTNQQSNQESADNSKTTPKRKRDTVWFNPPYNNTVSTNIGKEFLKLIEKHFPKENKLRKCVNRNCIKLSYSCTKNMKSIIQGHNKKIMNEMDTQPETSRESCRPVAALNNCNCRVRENCPMRGNCISGPIVYRATVEDRRGAKHTYIGSTVNFKDRFRNHTKSFRDIRYSTETTLSGFVWQNELGCEPEVKWEIIKRARPYKKGNRYCDLCITEKLYIDRELKKRANCLNKRSDLANRCVHRAQYRLTRA